jgi:uncharacterized protein YndB with AHSA1/START domain
MAVNTAHIDATPQQVFAVLSNGWTYSNWVVGTSHMRAVQAAWPATGSKLFHAAGVWPLCTRDETVVLAMEPDRLLHLQAKGRPFGEATIKISLEPDAGGTTVRMFEEPSNGPGKWLHNPVSEAVLVRRNTEALARLKAIVEQHTEPTD